MKSAPSLFHRRFAGEVVAIRQSLPNPQLFRMERLRAGTLLIVAAGLRPGALVAQSAKSATEHHPLAKAS
jgi:hypothetical protein